MRVACIGEAMVELSLDRGWDRAKIGFAGDTLNTAIYLKRAAPELDVSYITRLGGDDFSSHLRGFIASEGIETDRIEVSDSRQVGLYAITTDADGERSFTYWRSHSAAKETFLGPAGLDFAALEGVDFIYFSAITLAILPDDVRVALLAYLRETEARVGFDSNYRPALWESVALARQRIAEAWRVTDLAMPSVDDEMAVFSNASEEEVIKRFHDLGVKDGALKCGRDGPISLGETVAQCYPAAAHVVDTTAAGDSFNGGYLAAKLTGARQADALMAGHKLASYVVGLKGAIAPRG